MAQQPILLPCNTMCSVRLRVVSVELWAGRTAPGVERESWNGTQLRAAAVEGAEHEAGAAASRCAVACAALIACVRTHPHEAEMCFTGGWGWCRAGLAQGVLQCVQRGAGGSRAGLTSLGASGSNPTGIVSSASPRAEPVRRKDCILLNKFLPI